MHAELHTDCIEFRSEEVGRDDEIDWIRETIEHVEVGAVSQPSSACPQSLLKVLNGPGCHIDPDIICNSSLVPFFDIASLSTPHIEDPTVGFCVPRVALGVKVGYAWSTSDKSTYQNRLDPIVAYLETIGG